MATKVQIAKMVELDRKEHNATVSVTIGWSILLLALLASMGANVLSSALHGFSWFSAGFAVVPVLSLFAVSLLLERVETNWVGMTALSVVGAFALLFSWVHIAEVIDRFGHDIQVGPIGVAKWVLAWLFPIVLDVPMALSGWIIASARKVQMQIRHERHLAETAPRPQTVRTAPIETKPASPRKRTNAPKHAIPTTAQ